jgi:hypothetical protein
MLRQMRLSQSFLVLPMQQNRQKLSVTHEFKHLDFLSTSNCLANTHQHRRNCTLTPSTRCNSFIIKSHFWLLAQFIASLFACLQPTSSDSVRILRLIVHLGNQFRFSSVSIWTCGSFAVASSKNLIESYLDRNK